MRVFVRYGWFYFTAYSICILHFTINNFSILCASLFVPVCGRPGEAALLHRMRETREGVWGSYSITITSTKKEDYGEQLPDIPGE